MRPHGTAQARSNVRSGDVSRRRLAGRTRSRLRRAAVALGLALALGQVSRANAAPIRGQGSAKTSEWKKGASRSQVRARALRRARSQALSAAIENLGGKIDRAAAKAVRKNGDAWTGAYRVVRESGAADEIEIEIEAEIDLDRLAKRVAPGVADTASGALFRIAGIEADDGCGEHAQRIGAELAALGAVTSGPKGPGLSLQVSCAGLGPVALTHLHAARVTIVATDGTEAIASEASVGFGGDQASALANATLRATHGVAAELRPHQAARVMLRVQSPRPASRIRHLERRITDSVAGVRKAQIVGIEPDGTALLAVHGVSSAEALAGKLETLRISGFSLTIVSTGATDALTIRLQ